MSLVGVALQCLLICVGILLPLVSFGSFSRDPLFGFVGLLAAVFCVGGAIFIHQHDHPEQSEQPYP